MSKKKSFLIMSSFGLIIGAAIYSFTLKAFQTTSAKTVMVSHALVPEISCYPNIYDSPKKIDKFTYQRVKYYQIIAHSRKTSDDSILYFETSEKGCRQIGGQEIASRESYMPKPVAEYFADQYIEKIFQMCLIKKKNELNSKQKCKSYLENLFNVPGELNGEEPKILFIEDAEALNRRGIKTDKALIIRPKRSGETGLPAKNDLPSDSQANSKTKLTKNEIFQYQLSRLKTCNSDLPKLKITNFHFIEFIHENAFLMKSYRKSSELEHKNFGFQIALKINGSNDNEYYIQRVLYFHNANCVHAYTGKRGDATPLHSIFDQQDARSLALTWYKWRLAKIPRERNSTQGYLNSNYPALAEEEYWALSQLGYKMPKNYKLIP